MSDFYVSLPSHSSKSEFPENKANHFKIRLPHPIRLDGGGGWKVGMSSIAMPDAHVTLPPITKTSTVNQRITLAYYAWQRLAGGRYDIGGAYFDTGHLKEVFHNVDGVGFMKSMIAFFERQRIFDSGPKLGAKYVTDAGKRTYIDFKWEGEELVTNNEDTLRPIKDFPALHINSDLATKMGWIKKNDSGYELGPNLQLELFKDEIPDISVLADIHDKDGLPVFWTVSEYSSGYSFLKLSIYCNWRFLNLNKAFEVVVGSSSRSLFVYFDVGGSSVVGNQVTDLLREVNLIRRGAGVQYSEPYHIQYISVRKDLIDIIEVQVAETTGELTTFGAGNTILTLHFKKS